MESIQEIIKKQSLAKSDLEDIAVALYTYSWLEARDETVFVHINSPTGATCHGCNETVPRPIKYESVPILLCVNCMQVIWVKWYDIRNSHKNARKDGVVYILDQLPLAVGDDVANSILDLFNRVCYRPRLIRF